SYSAAHGLADSHCSTPRRSRQPRQRAQALSAARATLKPSLGQDTTLVKEGVWGDNLTPHFHISAGHRSSAKKGLDKKPIYRYNRVKITIYRFLHRSERSGTCSASDLRISSKGLAKSSGGTWAGGGMDGVMGRGAGGCSAGRCGATSLAAAAHSDR